MKERLHQRNHVICDGMDFQNVHLEMEHVRIMAAIQWTDIQ